VSAGKTDIKLLGYLDALLEQQSVTLAAAALGITQPSMSAALGRLRRHFHDPLLVVKGRKRYLTPLAVQLREQVRAALDAAERAMTPPRAFDPARSTRHFHVVASDYVMAVYAAPLTATIAGAAPKARLGLTELNHASVDQADHLARADVVIMPHGFIRDLASRDLYLDHWGLLVAAGNSTVGDSITEAQMASLPWVAPYESSRVTNPAVRYLRMRGIDPFIQVVTDSFTVVPGLLAGSERIACVPMLLARSLPEDARVRLVTLPFQIPPMIQAMWWHPLYNADPEHAFLRDSIYRVAAGPAEARH
jgi:DNA-binding transcriptional LysR family regulator